MPQALTRRSEPRGAEPTAEEKPLLQRLSNEHVAR